MIGPVNGTMIGRVALTLSTGTLGGMVAFYLNVPLAFMIGAMVVTTGLAMAGVGLQIPTPLRSGMIIVLGTMLGSSFTPTLFDKASEWKFSLAGLAAYILIATILGIIYLRKVAGYDPVTAYFTAMPGGFTEMILQGGANGGDDRTIALGHSLRILLVVCTVPIAFSFLPGLAQIPRDGSLQGLGPFFSDLSGQDALLLLSCALGAPIAQRLRIPAGLLVGPMIFSAILHVSGLTAATPPGPLVAAAQIVVGASIGCRFAGDHPRRLVSAAKVAAGLTAILLTVAVVMAGILNSVTGLDFMALVLAYAPGGLAEMSLVALSLQIEAAFVALHHIVRIVVIILVAPPIWQLIQRQLTKNS